MTKQIALAVALGLSLSYLPKEGAWAAEPETSPICRLLLTKDSTAIERALVILDEMRFMLYPNHDSGTDDKGSMILSDSEGWAPINTTLKVEAFDQGRIYWKHGASVGYKIEPQVEVGIIRSRQLAAELYAIVTSLSDDRGSRLVGFLGGRSDANFLAIYRAMRNQEFSRTKSEELFASWIFVKPKA